MQRMAANMGGGNMPYMPPGAAEQMKNMKPEDFARASEELGQMDPETLKSQMNNFKNQNQAQRDYALRGAEQLKTDGNKLVGEGKYNEAIEKYMRVKNNLADDPSAGAKTLRQSCQLNMSLCFNKTKRYNSAISECTEVLKQDGKALKAYYRRGQAHAAKEDWQSAGRGPAARGEARAGRRDGEGRARQGGRGPAKRGSHRRDERDVPGV
jgi:tetratricopeptide (TPR) repeat protein